MSHSRATLSFSFRLMMRLFMGALLLCVGAVFETSAIAAEKATTLPNASTSSAAGHVPSMPAGTDPQLWQQLLRVDHAADGITDLSANFSQTKTTVLLRKPLISTGSVRVKGNTIRWDTQTPEPNILHSADGVIRIYYPKQKLVERYRLEDRISELVASPLPRLITLVKHFHFEPLAITDRQREQSAEQNDGKPDLVAVRMVPLDEAMKKHVDHVDGLLDAGNGCVRELSIFDTDGDTTRITFLKLRTNVGLKDDELKLVLPEGIQVSRPLEALEH